MRIARLTVTTSVQPSALFQLLAISPSIRPSPSCLASASSVITAIAQSWLTGFAGIKMADRDLSSVAVKLFIFMDDLTELAAVSMHPPRSAARSVRLRSY